MAPIRSLFFSVYYLKSCSPSLLTCLEFVILSFSINFTQDVIYFYCFSLLAELWLSHSLMDGFTVANNSIFTWHNKLMVDEGIQEEETNMDLAFNFCWHVANQECKDYNSLYGIRCLFCFYCARICYFLIFKNCAVQWI